jgi:hypothetical protein
MADHIQYDFLYDNHFAELKEAELATERINLAQLYEPYVGKYFSNDYVRRVVLRQSDDEIQEQDKLIEKEIDSGMIPNPADMAIDPATGQPMPPELGAPANAMAAPPMPTTPEIKPPKGGEI